MPSNIDLYFNTTNDSTANHPATPTSQPPSTSTLNNLGKRVFEEAGKDNGSPSPKRHQYTKGDQDIISSVAANSFFAGSHENLNMLFSDYESMPLINALSTLSQAGISCPHLIQAVSTHQDPNLLANALRGLHHLKYDISSKIETVIAYPDLAYLVKALNHLITTLDNLNHNPNKKQIDPSNVYSAIMPMLLTIKPSDLPLAFYAPDHIENILIIFTKLSKANSLINVWNNYPLELNLNLSLRISAHPNMPGLIEACQELSLLSIKESDTLRIMFDMLIEHQTPELLAPIFTILKKNHYLEGGSTLLIADIKKDLRDHSNLSELCTAFNALDRAGLISEKAAHWLIDRSDPNLTVDILKALTHFSNENIEDDNDEIDLIYGDDELNLFFDRQNMPALGRTISRLLDEGITDSASALAVLKAADPEAAAELICIANAPAQRHLAQELNDSQSTHQTTVNISVSDTIKKLIAKPRKRTNEQSIESLRKFIEELSSTRENDAAKRCITRLMDTYEGDATVPLMGTDPQITVSLKQLIPLAYETNVDADTDFALFIQALHEIQRGDNFNEAGKDEEEPAGKDLSICPAGTFNKIIEKLVGIDPDFEVIFITKQSASLKLQAVVKNVAHRMEFQQITDDTWPIILTEIQSEMEPYKVAFGSSDAVWEAFLDSGKWTDLPNSEVD